jgi:hypothetical protein
MGPLIVKFLAPSVQALLSLFSQPLEFDTPIAVEAFMSRVILGTSGSATLQIDS